MIRKPPPLPPRKRSPSPSTRPTVRPDPFPDTEAVTVPKGKQFRAALLAKYWNECAPEDQAYLIRLAEQMANRNSANK